MTQADAFAAAQFSNQVKDVVYAGILHLDAGRYGAWLELTTSDLRYRITTYSPEIRKEMTWLEHDQAGLAALFELLPKHHTNHAQWFRHAVLYYYSPQEDGTITAVTSLAVYETVQDVGEAHVEAGRSRLFLVGRYHDRLRFERGRWLLSERNVRLETRQLGIGTHFIV